MNPPQAGRLAVLKRCVIGLLSLLGLALQADDLHEPGVRLRILSPQVLEVEIVAVRERGPEQPWYLALPAPAAPPPTAFAVTVAGRPVAVAAVGLKRRELFAPLAHRDLRVATWISLQLAEAVAEGAEVRVTRLAGVDWPGDAALTARADPRRETPVIHVNLEGYGVGLPKVALVGYFLGTAGELPIAAEAGFRVVTPAGKTVFEGTLTPHPETGYTYSPAPYQQVWAADFSKLEAPGDYQVVVPGLGASVPFRIGDGLIMNFARTYALGLYHQRCGTGNALPFTRFTHGPCHTAPASIPVPAAEFPYTWTALVRAAEAAPKNTRRTGAPLASEAVQLYPFVRRGTIDVAGGHHDAGDYSKYTTNSASLVHCLVFAVDSLAGVAQVDNLGLPESGDGIPDLLQEAKWESDFLAKLQDDDGGFYFLVYPRDRSYEGNVLPDRGDPQVVWPKNTAATAAAVAALAQASSSPRFRAAYPAEAKAYLEQARRGWKFLTDALARNGYDGAYQRMTHYGDGYQHDDELAWAACELYLATGEEEFHRKFREWCDPARASSRRWGWWRLTESWGHAIRSYAFGARSGRLPPNRLDARLLAGCEQEIEAAGRDTLLWSEKSAYGTSLPEPTKRVRGGGWYFSVDQAFDLAVASHLDYPARNDPRPQFLAAFVANLNYEGGCNPVNQPYVTGLGGPRQRVLVHQYAQNDRRVLPPSGLPVGSIQVGLPYMDAYRGELGALAIPSYGGAEGAIYPFYDRWTDTHNVQTEFVVVNQARALAGLAWLAAKSDLVGQKWKGAAGRITGLPEKIGLGAAITARFEAPPEMGAPPVEILWEGRDQQPVRGETFTFTPKNHGGQWVEAEARWADGRRVFAAANFSTDNGLPVVTVTAPGPEAAVAPRRDAAIVFQRTGKTDAPLTIRFKLLGTATKWLDYRRPRGDMPVEVTIPAGASSVTMNLLAVPEGLHANARHLVLALERAPGYNLAEPHAVAVAFIGAGAGKVPPAPALPALPD
jgi:hypothetical protein